MKQVFKRIISFSLSICIIVVSVLLCPISSYAVYEPGTSWWDKFVTETSTYLSYLASRVGAIVQDHDFAQWYQNREDYKEWWNTGHISRLEDSNGNVSYSFDADLVAQFKQALIEYSQETNGFYLLPTTDYRTVPAEQFRSAPQYRTFKNIVEEKGIIVVQIPTVSTYSFRFVDPFTDPDNPVSLVGSSNMISMLEKYPWISIGANFYGMNDWKSKKYRWQVFPDLETVYHTCAVSVDWNTGNQNYDFVTSARVNYDMSNHGSYYPDSAIIYSTSGEKVRVFVSDTAMKNYSVGVRTVYFGKDFYDFVPSDITATWDEINDRIEHIDDILQQLLDKITDSDDEDTIAELLQEILDAIKNGGGGNGDNQGCGNTGTGGGSYDDKNLLSLLSGYFGSVLSMLSELGAMIQEGFYTISYQLDLIYTEIGDMTEEEVSDKTDSLLSQLFSAFSELGDVLKGKFPFCLPNDLYTILALLAGDEVIVSPGTGGGGGGDGNGDVMICAYGAGNEGSKAPVFEIPFVIGSADIEEKIIIDLSPFEYISKLSRTLMTLYYCACLMQLTLKVIDLGKDLGDD